MTTKLQKSNDAISALNSDFQTGKIKTLDDLKAFVNKVSGDVLSKDGSSSSASRLLWSGGLSPDGTGGFVA
ncbi:hypothetical protein [Acinetobacter sp. ANC 3832]|uniref:hypothetical protein n=1 Tax=Acinetobacter sp. ANC 3832 TaxID=1977874 RepID=UPI000A33FD21|nr:hypothetical protein [Acinetobacter sp. ANC 3832]OTG93880.1 hypothetical protein B9T35_09290 [Acinetobacter sp. ANC 3832]